MISFCFYSISTWAETKQELEQKATEKLDSALDNAGLGAVGFGTGIIEVRKGNSVSAAGYIGGSIKFFKDAVKDFREDAELNEY